MDPRSYPDPRTLFSRRGCLRGLSALIALLSGAEAWAETVVDPQRAPPLMLAEIYRMGMPLEEFLVSEKYDGMRGYWDGHALWTRGGRRIEAPADFTANWPHIPLDGELWAGRKRYQQTVSTVRSHAPRAGSWRDIRFMVFDLPAHEGDFNTRLSALNELLPMPSAPALVPVTQEPIDSTLALWALLYKTMQFGGEGLMLKRGSSLYHHGRSADLLKLKPVDDADAVVVGHVPGRGRYEGRMGALLIQTPEGVQFKLGVGFNSELRVHPPPVGSLVTYRYNGVSDVGIPRFARFLRVCTDS